MALRDPRLGQRKAAKKSTKKRRSAVQVEVSIGPKVKVTKTTRASAPPLPRTSPPRPPAPFTDKQRKRVARYKRTEKKATARRTGMSDADRARADRYKQTQAYIDILQALRRDGRSEGD